jgi:CheY-like chemotaxis protein
MIHLSLLEGRLAEALLTTILAVDDSSTMRKVLELTFAGEGVGLILASGADQALGELRQARPPVALVDITLGNQNGYDLCRQIKSESPGTRVLLMSSKQHPYDATRGASVGADDHVDKPFDTQSLIDKVRALSAAAPARAQELRSDATASRTLGAPPPKPESRQPSLRPEPTRVNIPPAAENRPIAPMPRPVSVERPMAGEKTIPAAVTSGALASLETNLAGLGLTKEQILGVLALSREVVEQAVWEVVPVLAETLIKEEIQRLTR